MPVLDTGRSPDRVACADLLDGAAALLDAADSCGDDQELPLRMRVPCGTSACLERNGGTGSMETVVRVEQRRDVHAAGECCGWTLLRRLRSATCDHHGLSLHRVPRNAAMSTRAGVRIFMRSSLRSHRRRPHGCGHRSKLV